MPQKLSERQRKELRYTLEGGGLNILKHSPLFRTYKSLERRGLVAGHQDWLIPGIVRFRITEAGRDALNGV